MRKNWSILQEIISACQQDAIFLSLIDAEGTIRSSQCQNGQDTAAGDPREVVINFFDLLHPLHHTPFKEAIITSAEKEMPVQRNST